MRCTACDDEITFLDDHRERTLDGESLSYHTRCYLRWRMQQNQRLARLRRAR